MNLAEHLLQCAEMASRLSGHIEHLIIDFGSYPSVKRTTLPNDPRIRLIRVESPNGRWWLTHAYNLAFALAEGEYLLKLDADILLSQDFIDRLCKRQTESNSDLMCNRLTLQDWELPSTLFTTNGLFFCKTSSLAVIRGFNPYIQGWGWDEIDLYSRFFLAGFSMSRIPSHGLTLIDHNDDSREHPISIHYGFKMISATKISRISPSRRIKAQNLKNKTISIASLNQGIQWPSLDDYAEAFKAYGELPMLPKLQLFDAIQRRLLSAELRNYLLLPSRLRHWLWRVFALFRLGPYTDQNTALLLERCNIDLSLVS
jgi:glycosyltransferase involved in cell wall biosynthesis